jgi:hypothetical protein
MFILHPVRHFEVKNQPFPYDTLRAKTILSIRNINIFSSPDLREAEDPEAGMYEEVLQKKDLAATASTRFLKTGKFGERSKDCEEKESHGHPFSCRPHDDRRLYGLRIDTGTDKHGGTYR